MQQRRALGLYIKQIQTRMEMCMNQRLRDWDLTSSQINVMIYLGTHRGEKVTQREIGDYLRVRHTSVIDILKRLEAKGMIGRCVDADNCRNNNVWLTDQGGNLLQALRAQRDEMDATLVRDLTPEERDTLFTLLERIRDNLDENGSR